MDILGWKSVYNISMSRLSISLFGPPRIKVDGKRIKIDRRKSLALLAYLAVTGQGQSRAALAAMFWPEADQSRSQASLRSALWALNKTELKAWLVVEPETVALRSLTSREPISPESDISLNVDVVRFRDLISAVGLHAHSAAAICADCHDMLTEAVSLYENGFMAGFTLPDAPQFDEWQFFQADALRQSLATALRGLMKFHRARGTFRSAILYARRFVELDPLHEPAHQILMQLYAQDGQKSAALRQYEICRDLLASELGLEPAEETDALCHRIYLGEWETEVNGDGAFNGLESEQPESSTPHNLPLNLTPFIDREQERAALAGFLDDPSTRLLTIVGPGGIGKTRLSLAVAADQVSKGNFPDGIYFVSLTSLSEPEAIFPAIAEAAGFPFQPDQRSPRQQISDYLSRKSMLLLLDNFEHLILADPPDGATLVADLLHRARQLKILITSREQLNLYEEQRFPLQGLPVTTDRTGGSDTDSASSDLFLQTVRRRQPDFGLAETDGPYMAEICQLVEGMPLALELAASWIEVFSLREIAAEIRKSLDFLETNFRNMPARHRSMQAVFDTTWQSLRHLEQEIFARLSVFRGGFTLEAAEAVAGASLQGLVGLANKSLLRFNQSQARYENHELLRQFAAEKLGGAAEEIRPRHAAYYCTFLKQRESDLKGPRQEGAMAEIQADHENAVAAWQWAIEQSQFELMEKALIPLCLFYRLSGRSGEGESICRMGIEKFAYLLPEDEAKRQALKFSPGASRQASLLAKLLTWQGLFQHVMGQNDVARRSLCQAQAVLNGLNLQDPGVTATRALSLLPLSHVSIANEFGGKAETLSEESLTLFKSIKDDWGTTLALDAVSQIKSNMGLHEQAIPLQEESLAIRQRLGDRRGIARSYYILGNLVLHVGQIDTSETYLRKSLAILRTTNNPALLSDPLSVLGINLIFGGKFEECIASYEEAWAIHRELGLPQEPMTANVGMTLAKINLGRYAEARMEAQRDLARYRKINHRYYIAFTLFNLGRIDLVEGASSQAWEHLQESSEILENIKMLTVLPDVLFCLAYTARLLQDRQQAIQYMIQALKIVIETKQLNPMRFELPGMALLLADQGQTERAVEFYAAALKSPHIANSRWFEHIAGQHIVELGDVLPQDVLVAAQKRGLDRDLWDTVNAIMAELSEEQLAPITRSE
jgi:predicted ATPase/DNA-binding SARP family transcriptional activator